MVPEGWRIGDVNEVVTFVKSGLSRRILSEDIGIPVITSGNIQDGILETKNLKYWYLNDPQGANVEDYILKEGDILLNFINSQKQIGKLCVFKDIGRPSIYTTNIFCIRPKEKYLSNFLYFLFSSAYFQNEIQLITMPAVNQASFTKRDFLQITIPLPPLPEQKKIAEILSSVDEAIEATKNVIEQTKKVKHGLLQQLLTKGIGHTTFKPSPLGEIPEGWEIKTLGEVALINPRNKSRISDDTEVTFLSMPDVSEDAKIITPKTRHYRAVKKGFTNFIENDVLIAKITPCFENGKGALAINLVNGIGFGSTEFHVIRADKTIYPILIYLHTITPYFRKQGARNMTGSAGQKRVTKEFLKCYKIPIPPLPEQKKIAEILQSVDSQIMSENEKLKSLETLKKGLMHDLLTGTVRVQLDKHEQAA